MSSPRPVPDPGGPSWWTADARATALRRPRRTVGARPAAALLVSLSIAAAAGGCGKKGPPLPPLSNLPRAPEAVTARLQGDQVQIRFRIPRATQSNVQPANLQRVDVYALTGPTVPRERFLEHATLVASVPVRRPVPEGEEPGPVAPGEEDALEQGATGVAFETLTPEAFEPITIRDRTRRAEPPRRRGGPIVVRRTALAPPDIGTPIERAPQRHYVAVGVTRSGRRGLPSTVASVLLEPAPPAPAAPAATVREGAVDLKWEAPAGLRQPVQRATLAPKAPARAAGPSGPVPRSGGTSPSFPGAPEDPPVFDEDEDEPGVMPDGESGLPEIDEDEDGEDAGAIGMDDASGGLAGEEAAPAGDAAGPDAARAGAFLPARPLMPWPSVSSGYHVYAVPAEAPAERPSPYSADALPALLTARPLPQTQFTDSTVRYGDERCYVLRVAEVAGTAVREGPPSAPTCVTVADVFPPAAPRSLEAVASEGAVSLIWEANSESDLAGYVVIRSEGAETRIRQLTPEPITETTYRDTQVKAGVRYVYVVIAVDTASPPNRSAPSKPVEVFAR